MWGGGVKLENLWNKKYKKTQLADNTRDSEWWGMEKIVYVCDMNAYIIFKETYYIIHAPEDIPPQNNYTSPPSKKNKITRDSLRTKKDWISR